MSREETRQGYLGEQVRRRLDNSSTKSITPTLPTKMSIEINNSCNHECYFCQNPTMTRKRRVMDDDMVLRLIREGAEEGISEVSFYSGGEPFLNKRLAAYVAEASACGYDYIYLSSNGGKAVTPRLMPVLEAGLNSMKFSINAGNRETYKLVHGLDEFDDVIANVERVAAYRKNHNPDLKLFVTFVETALNQSTFEELKDRVGGLVDEVVAYPFVVIGTPLVRRTDEKSGDRPFISYDSTNRKEDWNVQRLRLPCYQLWNYLNVTVEGYLSACCSDYNNDLLVANLNETTLMGAWHSPEFQGFRQRHIDRKVQGTLCEGCIMQKERPYTPLTLQVDNVAEHVIPEKME